MQEGTPGREHRVPAQRRELRGPPALRRTQLVLPSLCSLYLGLFAFGGTLPGTHSSSLILSPFLLKGKDLVSEQTLQIQEAPEAELWGTGRGLPRETPFPVSLLPTPSIPLGYAQGRSPARGRWLWQQLWSVVSASLCRCPGSTPDDVSPRKGGSRPQPPTKPRTLPTCTPLGGEETRSRWVFSGEEELEEEKEWGGVLSP